jgi:hypothetical protein
LAAGNADADAADIAPAVQADFPEARETQAAHQVDALGLDFKLAPAESGVRRQHRHRLGFREPGLEAAAGGA